MNTTTKNKFQEIYEINVNKHVEKKNNLSYLSWAYAWAEIKKIDEKANFTIHENSEGHPFFHSAFGIDVKVSVTVNEITHTMRLPVMDGANKAMKAEPYKYTTKYGEKTVDAATSFDINKTIMRCLVKAVAMHGLGLYIYAGEDLPETVQEDKINELAKEDKIATTDSKPVNPNNFTWVVEGNSFPIRDELKKRNFKFDKEAKVWYTENNDPDYFIDIDLKGCKLVRLENEIE